MFSVAAQIALAIRPVSAVPPRARIGWKIKGQLRRHLIEFVWNESVVRLPRASSLRALLGRCQKARTTIKKDRPPQRFIQCANGERMRRRVGVDDMILEDDD
jgi:hypothetical protein